MFENGIRCIGAFVSIALLSACSAAPSTGSPGTGESTGTTESALDATDVSFNVAIRGTGTSTIHGHIFTNPAKCSGATVLAVHGLVGTGLYFGPLAEAIFADSSLSRAVKRIIAIDMPGHGDSTFPSNLPNGLLFGDLTIDDNVSVVIQSIDALRSRGLGPRVVIGHSMGGLEVQAAQQALLSAHSSFAAHGVLGAVLLAPVPPHGQQWVAPPAGDPTPFIVNDPTLGSYFFLPPAIWIQAGTFTRIADGTVVANAPTAAQAASYVGPEPLTTLLQLVESPLPLPDGGTFTIDRPTVSAGAFALKHGTPLVLASFSQDVLVPAVNLEPLYEYLTGDTHDLLYRPVVADDAVHGMLISDPASMLDALRPMF
jgi:pimeloyl-ACP methyl ester carboxylesterase